MKTLNVTAAILAASLPLTTLALAEDQPQAREVELEQDAVDGTQIMVEPGSQPVTIVLRVEDARAKRERERERKPVRQPRQHAQKRWAERDRPFVLTVGGTHSYIGGLHSEAGSRGSAGGWEVRLASDQHFWVAEVGTGSVGPPQLRRRIVFIGAAVEAKGAGLLRPGRAQPASVPWCPQ